MRVDVFPILAQAHKLVAAIEARSKSRASSEAHKLLCALPDPTWAETAPGMSIWYGTEANVAKRIEQLRFATMTWMALLISDKDLEPSDAWPRPANLTETMRELGEYMPQNASVSANTAPVTS